MDVLYYGDIIVGAPGVLGGNVSLAATRNISGLIVARQNLDLSAGQNFSGTILAAGNINLGAGSVSGVIIQGGGITTVAGVDTSLVAVAGTNVYFSALADGIAPSTYQWYKNGTNLPSATDPVLTLTNIHRADAGTYSIVVTNPNGAVTNDIHLRVLVPQLLSASFEQATQTFSVSFGDPDGASLAAEDITSFVIETSADLVDWTPTDLPLSTNSSGGLSFQLPISSDPGSGFYRVLSQ